MIRLPFHYGAAHWVRQKHNVEPYASSVSHMESEFNCKIGWDDGYCYLEFDDEQYATLFLLKWS